MPPKVLGRPAFNPQPRLFQTALEAAPPIDAKVIALSKSTPALVLIGATGVFHEVANRNRDGDQEQGSSAWSQDPSNLSHSPHIVRNVLQDVGADDKF